MWGLRARPSLNRFIRGKSTKQFWSLTQNAVVRRIRAAHTLLSSFSNLVRNYKQEKWPIHNQPKIQQH
jgi:hypothetical protein